MKTVVLRLLATLAVVVALLAASGTMSAALAAPTTCPAGRGNDARDYSGLTLVGCNFSGADLQNASFNGATLSGVIFIRANLQSADFRNAVFTDGPQPSATNDFTLANLSGARFSGARFDSRTYLTYANLSCADFSMTRLDQGTAIFGDAPLVLADPAAGCRTLFVGSRMNCEFTTQWNQLDLTGADISACANELQSSIRQTPFDFSDGMYESVVFDRLDLHGSRWTGAVLDHASFQNANLDGAVGLGGTPGTPARRSAVAFNGASMRKVDLSNALLYGANFDKANLSGSSLAGSFLTSKPAATPPIVNAASFVGAHLQDVNLKSAKLAGASFEYASFFSTWGGAAPNFPCNPTSDACASAAGADLTQTDFGSAYLVGVDFGGAETLINGTNFSSAILIAANFSGATFQPRNGTETSFTAAMLQGTQFDEQANLNNASLENAFVDFGAASNSFLGNVVFLKLSAAYTGFAGGPGAAGACVMAQYNLFSTPPTQTPLTCPDGSFGACGDSTPAPTSNPKWASLIRLANNASVPGWYLADSTYDRASPAGCNTASGW